MSDLCPVGQCEALDYDTVAAAAQCVAVIVPTNDSTESDLLDHYLGTYCWWCVSTL